MTMEQAAKKDPTAGKRPSARDRIFETACDLFYRKGIRGVGVESIAAAAGTTKMSLYRNFPSKDDLVVECLKNEDREFFEWWDEVIAPYADDPRAQIAALFREFETHTCCEAGSRGCALANAAVELPDLEHPARAVVLDHHRKIRSRLRDLCRKVGARDPDTLGDGLMLLMGGSYMARLIFPTTGAIASVTAAARILIDSEIGVDAPSPSQSDG
jgi:AcrR family transcriptional regulator